LPGKGYSFIASADGTDVFVHYLGIADYGFRSLEQGHRMEFEETRP
jgi:cold shock protein